MTQILIKENRLDEAMEFLSEYSQENENGDVYYLMSKIFELNNEAKSRLDCLEMALENKETLTFDFYKVRREYKQIGKEVRNG